MKNQSEIARLQRQIENETFAMQQALSGYAVVTKHAFIQSRYQAIHEAHLHLQALVGNEEALPLVFEAYTLGLLHIFSPL